MSREVLAWLVDIRNAITEINQFLFGFSEFEDFIADQKTKRAVERNIEIIGEAINRILNNDPQIGISNARRIVQTRNRIIHGYDTVSDEILWGIIHNHLPTLLKEVEQLIGNRI